MRTIVAKDTQFVIANDSMNEIKIKNNKIKYAHKIPSSNFRVDNGHSNDAIKMIEFV